MDSSREASPSNKDTSPSSSSSQADADAELFKYLSELSPLRVPLYGLLDGLESTNPFDSKKVHKEPSLVSEVPKIVHQENVDESQEIQGVECPSQKCRKEDSNVVADVAIKKQKCHDDAELQHAENEKQDNQEDTPSLQHAENEKQDNQEDTPSLNSTMQNVKECGGCSETRSVSQISSENRSRDSSERAENERQDNQEDTLSLESTMQNLKECGGCSEIEPVSQISSENRSRDGSEEPLLVAEESKTAPQETTANIERPDLNAPIVNEENAEHET